MHMKGLGCGGWVRKKGGQVKVSPYRHTPLFHTHSEHLGRDEASKQSGESNQFINCVRQISSILHAIEAVVASRTHLTTTCTCQIDAKRVDHNDEGTPVNNCLHA